MRRIPWWRPLKISAQESEEKTPSKPSEALPGAEWRKSRETEELWSIDERHHRGARATRLSGNIPMGAASGWRRRRAGGEGEAQKRERRWVTVTGSTCGNWRFPP